MAKKSQARRKGAKAQATRPQFDDSAYADVRFSATFDYNELAFERAAERLAPRAKNALMAATFVALLAIVGMAIANMVNTIVLVVLFVISFALLIVTNNWNRIQTSYARSTSLAPVDGGGRMHVVVCETEVHVEGEKNPRVTYPLADLRVVYDTSDYLVAGFGSKRYAYVPRVALSENRYRDLCRFLHEKA